MALHFETEIYKVTYELLNLVTDFVKNMPRDLKVPIGGKLRDECIEISTLIYRANVAEDKAPYLSTLIERAQVAELLIRLSRDRKLISIGQYSQAIELADSIGKQANGWRRSALTPVSHQPRLI
jgi:hypothetical protein